MAAQIIVRLIPWPVPVLAMGQECVLEGKINYELFPIRTYITRRFAELELYILMIKILQRFKLEYHGTDVGMTTAFVNKPNKKIRLRLVKRT